MTDMTDTAMTTDKKYRADDRQECQALLQTPGMYLQQAREKAGLNQQQVAGELRLSVVKLQALESDHYEKIASETFVKGYLRAYARVVDLDANEVLRRYREYLNALADTAEIVTHSVEVKSPPEKFDLAALLMKWKNTALIAGGLLLVWILAAYLIGTDNKAVDNAAIAPAVVNEPAPPVAETLSSDAAIESVESDAATESVESDTATETTGEEVVTEQAVISPEPAAAPSAVTAAEVVTESPAAVAEDEPIVSAQQDILQFAFTDECWVEVSDAKGDVLFTDLKQPGDSLTLEGKAPFKVMLGNARAVSLSLNGEPVDTTPRGNRKTVKMTVGQD